MTREEAIQILSDLQDGSGQTYEAIRMAIEALSADAVMRDATAEERASVQRYIDSISTEAVQVVRCKDCRHYAKGHCYMYGGQMNDDDYCSYGERAEQTEYKLPGHDEVMEALDKLTIRPHGKWIFREVPIVRGGTSFGYVCSNCGKDYWQVEGMDYCPNCGADMRGDSND